MRKFLLVLLLWLSPFFALLSVVSACSENEKFLAHGTTEEENAQIIKDTVAYLKLLKTWEPEQSVDSEKVALEADSSVSWYNVVFLRAPKPYFSYTDMGADSAVCTVNVYEDENGVRLVANLDSARELFTQLLQRDSMMAVVVDRLDKTYDMDNPAAGCKADSLSFVERCEKAKGSVVDQLGLACNELHLICTREIMPNKTAEEFMDSTATELKSRCADALGLSLSEMGNGRIDGKYSWRYLNPELSYGEVVDERDGQVYKTIAIDTLVWMAENLNYADSDLTPSLLGKNWCYDNEPDSCVKYGRLYTWGAAIDSVALANDPENPRECGNGTDCRDLTHIQGLCMDGWHLPSSSEIHNLEDVSATGTPQVAVLGEDDEWPYGASTLRSAYLWVYGLDTYGFSLLPGGYYLFDTDEFKKVGQEGYFWSLDYAEEYAWMFIMYDGKASTGNTFLGVNEKYKFAIPIRCVKD